MSTRLSPASLTDTNLKEWDYEDVNSSYVYCLSSGNKGRKGREGRFGLPSRVRNLSKLSTASSFLFGASTIASNDLDLDLGEHDYEYLGFGNFEDDDVTQENTESTHQSTQSSADLPLEGLPLDHDLGDAPTREIVIPAKTHTPAKKPTMNISKEELHRRVLQEHRRRRRASNLNPGLDPSRPSRPADVNPFSTLKSRSHSRTDTYPQRRKSKTLAPHGDAILYTGKEEQPQVKLVYYLKPNGEVDVKQVPLRPKRQSILFKVVKLTWNILFARKNHNSSNTSRPSLQQLTD